MYKNYFLHGNIELLGIRSLVEQLYIVRQFDGSVGRSCRQHKYDVLNNSKISFISFQTNGGNTEIHPVQCDSNEIFIFSHKSAGLSSYHTIDKHPNYYTSCLLCNVANRIKLKKYEILSEQIITVTRLSNRLFH